ncbi:hypothetical protein OR1_01476 [Geobacter sp. OR-1]|uniref:C40 family peptidase n=1 Tax=Geobacter sp. OR-1 TaxID=1266765 RepID=UPI000542F5E2|nr:NlpC/P60 family protein [Geobacter sp. OR-1]GAM09202.1 hypothetical protein OR1_01476 [Geobacter sp. OR-1]
MMRLFAQILFLLLIPIALSAKEPSYRYAVAVTPTPVLNSPEFAVIFGGVPGNHIKTDSCGQMRELEFIALPGTVFEIKDQIVNNAFTFYRVTTIDYPSPPPQGLFIDNRFVRTSEVRPSSRRSILPPKEQIIKQLRDAAGTPYVWGGNVRSGIPEIREYYQLKSTEYRTGKDQLAGLDCSGLLYEASGGSTPRNTSELVHYGKGVEIDGLGPEMLAQILRPLDLVVWPGHVLIVLDNGEIIESRLNCDGRKSGVVIRPLMDRLSEIMRGRKPSNNIVSGKTGNKTFLVRRWHNIGSMQSK